MALKSSFDREEEVEDVEEALNQLNRLIDRCKVMYEQYFMGIQKIPPAQLHRDAERRIRELTQRRIRNTGLRYRLTTLTQKFGSYNTYWKRTIRQIESGRYVRDINRAVRRANRMGKEIPEELVAQLPKLHRERIRRERQKAAERAEREAARAAADHDDLSLDDMDSEPELAWPDGVSAEPAPAKVREQKKHTHQLDDSLLGDFDMDSMFASITAEAEAAVDKLSAPTPTPKAPAKSSPPARPPAARPPPTPTGRPRPAAPATPPAAAKGKAGTPRRVPPRPKRPTPPRPAPPGAAPPPGMTEKQTRDLYNRYKQARELVGESTKGLTYDKLMNTLNKQAPRIMKQHGADGVSFSVVLKGDRAILKARPKKK